MRRDHFPVSLRGGQVMKPTQKQLAAGIAAFEALIVGQGVTNIIKSEVIARAIIEAIPVADHSALVARLRDAQAGMYRGNHWDLCGEAADALESCAAPPKEG